MSDDRLSRLVAQFVADVQKPGPTRDEAQRLARRVESAGELLTEERIPTLKEDELRGFFDQIDATGFVFKFDDMLGASGINGMRAALLSLVRRAAQGPLDNQLRIAFPIEGSGAGPAVISQIASARFPQQHWPYSPNRELDLLQNVVGLAATDALRISYTQVGPHLHNLRHRLVEAGLKSANFLTVDQFLWWAWERRHLPRGEQHYWKISPGAGAAVWDQFKQENIIAIGFDPRPNLNDSRATSRQGLRDWLDTGGYETGDASPLWQFYGEMRRGDAVCTYGHKQILGLGVITGDYDFAQERSSYKHQRDTEWTSTTSFSTNELSSELREKLQRNATIVPLTATEWTEIQAVAKRIDGQLTSVKARILIDQSLSSKGLRFTPWQIGTYYTALQTKGFVILSGISGTGKTKLAQHFAELLPASESSITHLTDDVVSVTVRPYMVKYGQLTIPKAAFRLFDPPPEKESQEVTLRYKGESQDCRLTHVLYGNTDYVGVNLRGAARQWFKNDMTVGELLVLEPTVDEDRRLTSLEMFRAAEYTGTRTKENGNCENLLFVPVRPDWRDSKSLLGYYNPLTSTYEWTDFLRFLQRAERNYQDVDRLAWFVILDEMNLAHVEYYFADLLSVLESGRYEEGELAGLTREPLRFTYPEDAEGDVPPRELRLPPNLYVVGTVNVDETTHAFSPKVLDRAFTLEFTDVDFAAYPPRLNGGRAAPDSDIAQQLLQAFTRDGTFERVDKGRITAFVAGHPEVRDRLQSLNNLLKPHDMHFGYRVFDEIVTFLSAAEQNAMFVADEGEYPPLDAAVLMKVLPKFHGSRGKLEAPLRAVLAWCLSPDAPDPLQINRALANIEDADHATASLQNLVYAHPNTATRAIRMLRALYTDGFAAFG